MECELCGRECECRPATVDGVRMMLCPGCMKHGKGIPVSSSQTVSSRTPILERIRRPKEKDVYKDMTKELVSDYNTIIKNGREKKGLSREELGFRIGERTVTISKIENGDLKPSDKVAQKLEKELGINLFEEVASAQSYATKSSGGSRSSLTLGDFIKRE
jgi:putative transcription factor